MYKRNIWLLYAMSLLTGLSFAAAMIVPFFNEAGLDQTQIMLLQAVFSFAVVTLEVPTGYVADHYGRAMSLRLGSFMVAIGLLSYSFANGFGQFILTEIVMACGFALLSGAIEALAYDSLLEDNNIKQFRRYLANSQTFGFAAVAIFSPFGGLIAAEWGLRTVLVLDGILAALSFVLSWFLREPPMHKTDNVGRHPIRDMREVFRYCMKGHEQLPLFIMLSALLSTVTYFGFWFAPAYFAAVGLPLALFGAVHAVRGLFKALMSQAQTWVSQRFSDSQQLQAYALLGVGSYLALAMFGQVWAIILLLGFDVVQALHKPVVSDRIQSLTPSHMRAQVGSVSALLSRAAYGLLGPILGFGIDQSVRWGLVLAAAVFAPTLGLVIVKLKRKGGL